MNARVVLWIVVLCLWPALAVAQGFAGLGQSPDGFADPMRGHVFEFPDDHGPHPEFRIEWWYVTANLVGQDGRAYGVQWTLFRSGLKPLAGDGWQSPQLWMGHAAITTPDRHLFDERLARGGIGQAGVHAEPFEAWIDEWTLTGPDFDNLRVSATGPEFAYDLSLTATGPLVLHGDSGYSVKSADGQASHYYSQPSFEVTGEVTLPEGSVSVTGRAWLDREWSSQPLASDQSGWDWFSLSFDDGAQMMAFWLRGARGDFASGTWVTADGQATPIADGDLQATPLSYHEMAGRRIPIRWQLRYAKQDIDVEISALNPAAWMGTRFAYWEGPVKIDGSRSGVGYLEMTGYE
ncbi:MAG: lipocalin-like domain-containing protein [Pseudomonadota bacterium]